MLTSRAGITAATLLVLTAGCTGEEQPPDVARTDATTTPTSASEATPTEPAPEPEPEPVVFEGGTGASVDNGCDDDSPAYLSLYQRAEIGTEVRFGEVTIAGEGQLVGRVFIAPTRRQAPDRGTLVVDDRPGFGAVDDRPEWRDRVPLQGQLVQPGSYLVFAQVEVPPGPGIEGLDVSFFDSNSTSSARLDVDAEVTRRCRG